MSRNRFSRLLILFIIILMLVTCGLVMYSSVNGEEEYLYYFPIVGLGESPKAGLAFSSHADGDQRVEILRNSVSYWRGWQIAGSLPEDKWGLEFTPSLWCDFFARDGITNILVPQLQILDLLGSDYSGYLLFLNEPDLSFYNIHGQCETTPYRAAQLYAHVRAKLPNAKLVGPGISHLDYLHGFLWLDSWWQEVEELTGSPPQMAAYDVHSYLSFGDPLAPYDSLQGWLAIHGVENPKIWVTEWGSCSPERVKLMKTAFDNDSRIERHYWYDQYKAYWDGNNRCMTLYNEEFPISLNSNGEAFVNTNTVLGEPYP